MPRHGGHCISRRFASRSAVRQIHEAFRRKATIRRSLIKCGGTIRDSHIPYRRCDLVPTNAPPKRDQKGWIVFYGLIRIQNCIAPSLPLRLCPRSEQKLLCSNTTIKVSEPHSWLEERP